MNSQSENPKSPTVEAAIAKIGLAGSTRHVFFCTHGDCAPKEVGEASWKYLKKRLREVEMERQVREQTGQPAKIRAIFYELRVYGQTR